MNNIVTNHNDNKKKQQIKEKLTLKLYEEEI